MKVLKPVKFVQSMLLSSTATDSTPIYSPTTTYAKDALVQYEGNIYISLVASNIGKTPGVLGSEGNWLIKGPTNVYAMFDNQVSTQTIATSPLTVTFAPSAVVDTIALVNISSAVTVSIDVLDKPGGVNVFSRVYQLDGTIITDWFGYFFEPFNLSSELIIQGIPLYSSAVITISITSGGSVGVGSILFGNVYKLGHTAYGSSVGIRDYSIKETDAFGNTTFVQRPYSRRGSFSIDIPKANLNKVSKILESIRTTPVVWIATEDDNYQFSTIFGYYKDYNIEISYPSHSLCSLDIEGLT